MNTQDRKDRIREALDYDQIREVRLAIRARREELGKHKKKTSDLGLDAAEVRRRMEIIDGTDTDPGLLALIVPVDAYEDVEGDPDQADVFFDTPTGEEAAVEEAGELEEGVEEVFVPTEDDIEEARQWLGRHGWPEGANRPDGVLGQTIRLVGEIGWAAASRLFEGEGSPETALQEETADVKEERSFEKGDVVKMDENRRYVFRMHNVFDDRVSLEDSRGRELRPLLDARSIEWDQDAGYWVVRGVAPDVFTRMVQEETYVPEPTEDVILGPPPPSPASAEADVDPPDPGDPVVVLSGEEMEVYVLGPIQVLPPHWAKIVQPDDSGDVVGRVERDRLKWDSELGAWTIPLGRIEFYPTTEAQQTTGTAAH